MENGFLREKIDPITSPEYLAEYNKESQTAYADTVSIFGSREIKRIDEVKTKYTGKKLIYREKTYLDSLRRKWIRLFKDSYASGDKFLENSLKDSDTMAYLISVLKDIGIVLPEIIDAKSLSDILKRDPTICGDLPDELIELITRTHIKTYRERENKFEQTELPKLLAKVDEKFKRAIHNGSLPIDLAIWEKFKNNTAITLADPIFQTEDVGGSYNPKRGIQLSPLLSAEHQEKVLIHEFLHALSGKTVTKVTEIDEEYQNTDFDDQRLGLGFSIDVIQGRAERFRWLNEAVTEDLTCDIGGPSENESYVEERKLLKFLCKKLGATGKQLFVAAYMENSSPSLPPEKNLEHFRKLMQAIDAKFGKRFLVRLDMFIYGQRDDEGNLLYWEAGVENAVDEIKKIGDDFPHFLDNWIKDQETSFKNVSRNIVKKIKQAQPRFFEGMRGTDVFDRFDEMWEKELLAMVPHPSKYETNAIKQLTKELFLKEVRKQDKKTKK